MANLRRRAAAPAKVSAPAKLKKLPSDEKLPPARDWPGPGRKPDRAFFEMHGHRALRGAGVFLNLGS